MINIGCHWLAFNDMKNNRAYFDNLFFHICITLAVNMIAKNYFNTVSAIKEHLLYFYVRMNFIHCIIS